MESLFLHLGINWKLLIAQGANFFILALVLNYFLYNPLVELMKNRRRRIEEGLENAKDVERRLAEIEALKKEEILKGEREALAIIEEANKSGQGVRSNLLRTAEGEAEAIKKKAEDLSKRLVLREMEKMEANAKSLLEQALSTAVSMNPESIDKKLIEDAVGVIKNAR